MSEEPLRFAWTPEPEVEPVFRWRPIGEETWRYEPANGKPYISLPPYLDLEYQLGSMIGRVSWTKEAQWTTNWHTDLAPKRTPNPPELISPPGGRLTKNLGWWERVRLRIRYSRIRYWILDVVDRVKR